MSPEAATASSGSSIAPTSHSDRVLKQKRSTASRDRFGWLPSRGAPLVGLIILSCVAVAKSAVANIDFKSWESLSAGKKVCGQLSQHLVPRAAAAGRDRRVSASLPLYITEPRSELMALLPYARDRNHRRHAGWIQL